RKIKLARKLIEKSGANTKIEVDGGVNLANAPNLLAAGAHILVSGSFIFGSENPTKTISALKGIS
ncbi:MAG: ribulose-phosphate 3-epimerase, partial [Gelidibacter sp.]